ncbi:unnamed protein product [Anisakis simplex]|uniref:Growth-regulating factor n=1 Tax=Anisakis simplex TaxID=6269 RepID=A0A0M3JN75_ANISI|nr:unnamed protein product [Anisakis simplex]
MVLNAGMGMPLFRESRNGNMVCVNGLNSDHPMASNNISDGSDAISMGKRNTQGSPLHQYCTHLAIGSNQQSASSTTSVGKFVLN